MGAFVSNTLNVQFVAAYSCLAAQFMVSMLTGLEIKNNRDKYPIRQLSPCLTSAAAISFFMANLASVLVVRLAEDEESLLGPCRLYESNTLQILSAIYVLFREMSIMLIIVKTFRVARCFYDIQISRYSRFILKREIALFFMCLLYSAGAGAAHYIAITQSEWNSSEQVFQLLCPIQHGWLDTTFGAIRWILLCLVFVMSLRTLPSLRLKPFLCCVFLINHATHVMNLLLIYYELGVHAQREPFYQSLLANSVGTVLLHFFSFYTQKESETPQIFFSEVNFYSFFPLHTDLMQSFILHLEKQEENNAEAALDRTAYLSTFRLLRQICVRMETNELETAQRYSDTLKKILTESKFERSKISNLRELQQKVKRGKFTQRDMQNFHEHFISVCKLAIFDKWRCTYSCDAFEEQFKRNGGILHRMDSLNISYKQL